MVAQKDSRLDFAEIMDKGKIFLARLSHGAIGEENAYLLGTFLVSKFHQMALGRQGIPESQRRYFWLYVDEFHNFATPSMASCFRVFASTAWAWCWLTRSFASLNPKRRKSQAP